VLREIGIPEEIFAKKYLEVWNKIDLVADQEDWLDHLKLEMEMSQPNYPVVMMSCKDGTNKELFLESVQSLT
jgi:50S ribosomal subunit-associated GTPase HflX